LREQCIFFNLTSSESAFYAKRHTPKEKARILPLFAADYSSESVWLEPEPAKSSQKLDKCWII